MQLLFLCDRLSVRGGADQHLLQVIGAARSWARVTVAYGRRETEAVLPAGVQGVRIKGLSAAVSSSQRLSQLPSLLQRAEVVHLQNVMNPVVLGEAVATGRAVVTVQDHRVLCPGTGKTMPDGSPCRQLPSDRRCRSCLTDAEYRRHSLGLTRARCDALAGARLVVLSRYLADELARAGLPGAQVLPPWVEPADRPVTAGQGLVLGGRLVSHKAVLDAWQAWRLAGTGMPLRVAGAGPLASRLEGAELLGWLPEQQLHGVLAQARALLFPSFWQEPFGMLGVQALAMGTPVIVATTGGTGEWSDAGCLRVAAGDVGAMADAISRLAKDPDLACRLAAAGRQLVAARFTRELIEPQLRALHRSLAG